MVYKVVGTDEAGTFPSRVEKRIPNVGKVKSLGSGVDNSAAIQAEIDARAAAAKFGVVVLEGDFGIASTVNLKGGVKIIGGGGYDAAAQPGTNLRGLAGLSGPILKYTAPSAGVLWHHGGLDRIRIRDAPAGHGVHILGGMGESTTINDVMITGCSGDGLRIEGASTPLHIGHLAPHSNGGAGLRLVTQTETHTQILYLGGDNNGESLMTIDGLDTASSVQVVGWKAERWGATPGHPDVFLINNGNGAFVDLGTGRVHIGSGVSAGNNIIRQTSSGSVARVKWRLGYHNGGGADYTNGYNDVLNSIVHSITVAQRASIWAGESISFMRTSGNWVKLVGMLGGPEIWAGSGTPEATVTAPIGSLAMRSDGGAGTSLYVKQSGTGNTGWAAK